MVKTTPLPVRGLKESPRFGARDSRTQADVRVGHHSVAGRVPERHLPGSRAGHGGQSLDAKTIFFLALLLAGSGLVSAPVALLGGIVFGFAVEHPFRHEASTLSKLLLQLSVVFLGFGMDLREVVRVGRSGFAYTAVSIASAVVIGLLLGKLLQVGGRACFLITMGTAICGGSAIAALAPVTEANEEEISVAMGTIFVLNSLALLIFPAMGWRLHLDQGQFGLWCALAVHDTSSVVGAAAKYGQTALAIATTVKLARALWIIPVSLVTALFVRGSAGAAAKSRRARIKVPWFIFLFLLASIASTLFVRFAPLYTGLNHLGRLGLTATLFLIGTSLSWSTLKRVGRRPLLMGVLLWVFVGGASLAAIYFRLIRVQ